MVHNSHNLMRYSSFVLHNDGFAENASRMQLSSLSLKFFSTGSSFDAFVLEIAKLLVKFIAKKSPSKS